MTEQYYKKQKVVIKYTNSTIELFHGCYISEDLAPLGFSFCDSGPQFIKIHDENGLRKMVRKSDVISCEVMQND